MIMHYFKVAIRNLAKQKGLAFINIIGLSIGLTCFILFLLYAVNEFNFDRFHVHAKNIYRVYETREANGSFEVLDVLTSMPLGPTIKKDLPDVENYTRLRLPGNESLMRIDSTVHRVKVSIADPQFFSVFTFPFKYGNGLTALQNINSIVVTESKAKELFGDDNVIGRAVQIKVDDVFQPFVINGVAKDIPANSSIRFDVMASFDFLKTTKFGSMFNNWYTTAFHTYIQLRSGSSLPNDAQRLLSFHRTYYPDEETASKTPKPLVTYALQSLLSSHTDTKLNDSAGVDTVNPKTIWIILSIATGLLLIACINFTTLAIGRSAGRSKEVGVRKVVGAERRQLVLQFLAEAILLSVFSTTLGVLLAEFLLPYFNQLAGRDLHFSFALYPEMGWFLGGLVILVGLLSGSYPALLLSRFRPVEVLKNKMRIGGSNLFTKSLVTLQFALSIGLIVSTIIILQQTKYMTSKNPGFNKENVIVVDAVQIDAKKIYPVFKQALLTRTEISGVATAEIGLNEAAEFGMHGFMYYGKHKSIFTYLIDPDYINVLGMQLVAGRNFSSAIADDTVNSVIVNEAMVNDFGWTLSNAIGQRIKGFTNKKSPVVIGVVKNFNYQPLKEEIRPQLFHQFAGRPRKFFIRIKPGNPVPVLAHVQKTWNNVVPDAPFTYSFLDEELNNLYKAEQRWSHIVGWAGGISIFLACLGLFGLAILAAVNRTKEIGIRKVFGASVPGIVTLMSKDFLKLVIIAFFIASPPAWYFMDKWLQDFAYRINISVSVFLLVGFSALLIALTTVSIHAIKAAVANPVKSLRSE